MISPLNSTAYSPDLPQNVISKVNVVTLDLDLHIKHKYPSQHSIYIYLIDYL